MTTAHAPANEKLDSPTALAGLIFPATVGVMTPFLSPSIVGGLVDVGGWSEQQAGLLVAAELNVFAWSGLAGILWLNRLPWRALSLGFCLIYLFANFMSCFTWQDTLLPWRILSGFAAGSLIALCYGALARSRVPHRNYAFFSMSQMALAMLCLIVLPVAIRLDGVTQSTIAQILRTLGVPPGLGMAALFGALLLLGGLATLCAALWTPERPKTAAPGLGFAENPAGQLAKWVLAGVMLLAIFALMVSHQSLWTYAERIGASAGIAHQSLGLSLSLGTLAGFVGAMAAATFGGRLKRTWVIIGVFAIHLLALAMFSVEATLFSFFIGIMLHKFSWNFMIPYQLGMMAEIDRGGRAAIFSTFITSIGISTGAAMAAMAVARFGYSGIIVIAMLFAIGYCGIMLAVAKRLRTKTGASAPPQPTSAPAVEPH
ncbi:MAG: hypothetical protein Tsb0016_02700 [Sphingomonadales bacterium]